MLLTFSLAAAVLLSCPTDDLIPSSIEAALSAPNDPVAGGLPGLLEAQVVSAGQLAGVGRCLADVGDVSGDGAADYALGLGPGAAGDTLLMMDSVTGDPLWSAHPDGGAIRSLRAFSVEGGRLAVGMASLQGRVEVRASADGRVLWMRDLAPLPTPASPAFVSSVCWVPDMSQDGQPDLLVAGGGGLLGCWLLSGVDGSDIWSVSVGDVVADAILAHDGDGDGTPDVLLVGGELAPFARLVSGVDGALLWEVALDGPGSVGLAVDDSTGDGIPEVAVGQFAEPAPCVLALDGSDGSRLWASQDMTRNVTSLALMHDTLETGLRDIAVGSFDNAINVLLLFNGGTVWRREASSYNTGSMFSVAVTADLDGNGSPEVLSSCLDQRVYLHGGTIGQFMAMWESERKLAAVAALADITGDGKPEALAAGVGRVAVLDGGMGLASGPRLEFTAPKSLADSPSPIIWSYPTTQVILWAALAPDSIPITGVVNNFGLDPSSLVTVFKGPAPGAGTVALSLAPLPRSAVGLDIWLQAVNIYSPSHAILSNVQSFTVQP